MQAYDPQWEEADKRVLVKLGVDVLTENKMGNHNLESHLVYMPHCPRPLYEDLIAHNFIPDKRFVVLGNDLRDYLPDGGAPTLPNDFEKPKKKRKDRATYRPKETVLSRIVPHLDIWPMSDLPETHLPGFARAFLSMAFQWVARKDAVDWGTDLPAVEFPDDNEML